MTSPRWDAAIRIGGRPWHRPDFDLHRVYLPLHVWAPLIGLEIDFYHSGNIASATLNGRHISNTEATRIVNIITYVTQDGHLHITYRDTPRTPTILKDLHAALTAALDTHTPTTEDSQ